ncbi:MAG: SLC13 family permease [Humidesulfovibrio sp.]|uniref:SLC13 family permease n=1 Tax=Humidesulfovibrio sp. TaxID=2910988 RepID=UPI0027FFEC7D|nr:SLC13 family permease [Humidesulfovibrio sp.]MDQ7834524.1 SLC13 family permease [Humidesulfovibrio sp.]
MQQYVAVVFALVYAGMIFGGLPGLALNRTAVALLGAIALLAGGVVSSGQAWAAVDMPTMSLLFGLMLVSAQLRLSGFYDVLARRIASAEASPRRLLLLVMAAGAGLSALLVNDIVCLALTPILAEGCLRRGLNPVPFLIGLACAANIGSAATLIGNPQNMLIGQVGGLPFAAFTLDALPPVLGGLLLSWAVIVALSRRDWLLERSVAPVAVVEHSLWPTLKGCLLLLAALAGFLFTSIPREVLALGAGALVLVSRRTLSRRVFELVDWELLLLFLGLFVVNHALAAAGLLEALYGGVRALGVDLSQPGWLFGASALLSNLISNVPAVMLLLPVAHTPQDRLLLSLSSTLAGNLFLLGSIANLIVAEQAARLGVYITWRSHLRLGLPVTLCTFAVSALWLWLSWGELLVAR